MESGISEIIRYQTPLIYMRRTATEDVEIGEKTIKKGDKVVMWYLSGNRDEDAISQPDEFIINRMRAGRHLSFGFGPHRCIGRRLAEMQIRVLWEEIIRRKWIIQPTGNTERTVSNFINGFNKLEVIIRN
jgi:cytochrome P450